MKNYSEASMWTKVKKFAKQAGYEVIEKALWLYYAAQDPETPVWAKSTIYGALAYFIMPFDAIPDILPGVGYTDDLGVLAGAVLTVSAYVTDKVKAQTAVKMKMWFV